jgi:undecaprenyl-diphosphatase
MAKLSAFRFTLLVTTLFAASALALALGGPGSAADRAILYHFQQAPLVPPARLLTQLGGWEALIAIAAAATLWMLWKRMWRRALLYAAIVLSGRALVETGKLLFDRARPDPQGHLTAVHSMAFPSGHSANSMTVFLAFALLAVPAGRQRRAAVVLAVVLAMAVGLTRPILGVHWPSDVAGGWAFGAGWTLLLARLAGPEAPEAR